jgi:Predicted P-loop ATPase
MEVMLVALLLRRKKLEERTSSIYLNDLPLSNGSNDNFQAIQVAEVLKQSIEQATLPLHISLLGRWGSGKTTVIKILEDLLKGSDYELKIISVWKFADDATSLHRKIIREIERKLNKVNPESLDVSTTFEKSLQSKGVLSNLLLLNHMGNYRNIIIWNLILVVILTIVQLIVPAKFTTIVSSTLLSIIFSFAVAFLSKNNIGMVASIKDVRVNLPLNHGDQYENRFRKAVEEYLGEKSDKKLILVFDDLDRLPPKQLYGALNTIKTFLDSDRCAFIIPCDEKVLKDGLKEAFDEKEMKAFDVTEYLNKTFDITISLPKLEQSNMKKYAQRLLEENNIIWYQENEKYANELLAILIHSDVKTPRHVKKNLNAFATDWELAKRRDNNNKNGSFLTKHPLQLAIFTVLKVDFNDFYHLIMEEPFLINEFFELNEEDIKDKLQGINNVDSLRSFLSRVDTIIPEDPRPFIYFSNQELNPLTGRLDLEQAKKYIINGQMKEFMDSTRNISEKDLGLVFSSVINDINSSIETENVFSIIFEKPDVTLKIEENDKFHYANTIKNNIELIMNYEVNKTLTVFNNIVSNQAIWSLYGRLLSEREDKYLELLESHKQNPQYVENLKINNIYDIYTDFSVNIGQKREDIFYVPKLIFELEPEHELVNGINWYNSLINCLEYYDKESDETEEDSNLELDTLGFNLANWVKTVQKKTGQFISSEKINNILKIYNFLDVDSLMGITSVWIESFKRDKNIKALLEFINVTRNYLLKLSNDNDLRELGNIIAEFDDMDELNSEIEELLNYVRDNDEDSLPKLLNAFKDTLAIVDFSVQNFSFDNNDLNNAFLTILKYRDKDYSEEALTNVMNKATNQIFNQPTDNGSDLLLSLIKDSNIWLEEAKKYKNQWFNVNSDIYFWFKWNVAADNYYTKLEIHWKLCEDSDPSLKGLVRFIQKIIAKHNNLNSMGNYPYREKWQDFINKAFVLLINTYRQEDEWLDVFELLLNVKAENNPNLTKSIFDFLHVENISKFLNKVPNVVSLSNETINNLLYKYAELENSTQLNHIISRWRYFSADQREQLTSEIPEDKEILLVEHIKENSELEYIDELGEYKLNEEIVHSIMHEIVLNTNKKQLNDWIAQTIKLFNEEGLHHWRASALKYSLTVRDDIEQPRIDDLQQLFSFKDERTEIAFKLTLKTFPRDYRNNSEFREKIRESILSLEDDEKFKELVYEAKKQYRWKNTSRK